MHSFYYGWVIVGCAVGLVICGIPGQTAGLSVFNEALMAAAGVDRVTHSTAYTAGTVLSGLSLPWVGRLSDRLGARRSVLIAVFILLVGLLALSAVEYWSQSAWLTVFGLGAAFWCVRLGGAGWMMLLSSTLVGRWFERRRGIVGAIVGAGTSLTFAGAPVFLEALRLRVGWRDALLVLALLGLAIASLLALFIRESPAACGLEGDPLPHSAGGAQRGLERRQALRTTSFWFVTLGASLHALLMTAVTFHLIDLGRSLGLSAADTVWLLAPLSSLAVVFGFLASVLANRAPMLWSLFGFFLCEAVGAVATALAGPGAARLPMIAGLGLAGAFFAPLGLVLLPRAMGPKHLGAIQGIYLLAISIASSIGPVLFASSRRYSGSYGPALYGVGLVAMLLALLCWSQRASLRPFSATPSPIS